MRGTGKLKSRSWRSTELARWGWTITFLQPGDSRSGLRGLPGSPSAGTPGLHLEAWPFQLPPAGPGMGHPSGCTQPATGTWLAMPKTWLLSALLFLEENP